MMNITAAAISANSTRHVVKKVAMSPKYLNQKFTIKVEEGKGHPVNQGASVLGGDHCWASDY